jgi:hypothetical protein
VKQPVHVKTPVEPPDGQRATADRIAQSAAFSRSPRLREMFLYIMECTFAGRLEDLTEIRIAEKVFGRSDYHPAEDNIVRVSARQLRSKIADYYKTERHSDDLEIEIPKGGYLATFGKREEPTAPVTPLLQILPGVVPQKPKHFPWLAVFSGILSCVALALLVVAWKENQQLRASNALANATTLFDSFALNPDRQTEIVVTDSALILYEKLLGRYVTLEEYATNQYQQSPLNKLLLPKAEKADFLNTLTTRQISSLADMRITATLLQAYPGYGRNISVHHARHMHARDFSRNDNFVVLGSARSNPWATLFESALNFQLQTGFGSSCFEDKRPELNKPRQFCSQDSEREAGTDYARVAVMHNGEGTGRVLLIAGIHMESTEAAGKFFLDPRSVADVLRALGCTRVEELPDYELLLRSDSVGGAGRSAQIVYARKL